MSCAEIGPLPHAPCGKSLFDSIRVWLSVSRNPSGHWPPPQCASPDQWMSGEACLRGCEWRLSFRSLHSFWLARVPKPAAGKVTSLAPPCRDHTRVRSHTAQLLALAPGRANAASGEIRPSHRLSSWGGCLPIWVSLPMENPHRAPQALWHRAALNTPVLMFHQSPSATGGSPGRTALLGNPWTGTVRADQPPDVHK